MRHLILISLLALAACQGADRSPASDGGTTPERPRLLVGAAKRMVVPTESQIAGELEPRLGGVEALQHFHLGGFGIGPLQNFPDPLNQDLTEPAGAPLHVREDGQAEPTWLRMMVIEDPANGARTLFVALDAVGAGNIIQAGVKAAIGAATGIAEADILFGQTHSHAGADLQGLWGGVPQSWIEDLYARAGEAAAEAIASLRPAQLTFAQAELPDFNNYRRPRVQREAEADTTATLLRARDPDSGVLIASLLQYNAHPTSVGTGNDPRVPHADYILGAMETLEADADSGVALFFNGPIADASGSGGCEGDDYVRVYCRGRDLALAISQAEEIVLAPSLASRHVEVILPITNPVFVAAGLLGSFNRYYNFTELPTDQIPGLGSSAAFLPQLTPVAFSTVSRVTLGDALEIVTMPGEATNTFGEYIQALAAPRATMLLGLTHNSFGYIIPEDEFSYIDESGDAGFTLPFTSYEEYVSMGPLTAPMLRIQAYAPLFDAPPERFAPPALAACYDPALGGTCIIDTVLARADYIQRAYHQRCVETFGEDNPFCGLIAPAGLF